MATDRLIVETDVRSVLSAIRVPAPVLHRRENAWMRVGHARYLVEHIPDARAIRCAMAIRDASQSLDLRVRTGLHAGEVLVSSRVADPVAGSDLTFDSRGRQTLKGIPRKWELLLARHDPTAADS